jgi:pimeloyl-ACP methyl ester carboxylesterase
MGMRVVWRILGGLLVLAIVVIAAGFGYRAWRQHENAASLAITTPNGIVEESFVKIGGVDQWVQIRGQDKNNPVLLILSGGPGNSLIQIGYPFLPVLEKDYTVVNWDQRGAGLTYVRNGGNASTGLSIAQMTKDTNEVADYLRKRLGKKKVILLGWSWGSILGIEAIHARPDLYSAYVGTGQFVSGVENEAVGYASLLARAKAAKDEATVKALTDIGPPPYDSNDKMGIERKNLIPYTPPAERAAFGSFMTTALFAPGYGLSETYQSGIGAPQFSIEKLWPSVTRYDARKTLDGKFAVPFFVIDGADDIQVPMTLARDWFATIHAPNKEFITIPGAAHLALATHTAEFVTIMNAKVRPIAVAADQ